MTPMDAQAALGAAAVAVLELDQTLAGQFLLSRPLVVALVAAWILGEPSAAWVGVIFELLSLEKNPVGADVPPNAAVACGAAVLAGAGGTGEAPWALAVPAGIAAGHVFRHIDLILRKARSGLGIRAEEALRAGRDPRLGRVMARSLAVEAASAFAFLMAWIVVVRPLLAWSWLEIPASLRRGLDLGLEAAPFLGAAVLARAVLSRR